MSLDPGIRLGAYEVLAKLGEGGMGEVYRARDTKLDRDVALKVLPRSVAEDPDRLARFEREAKVLASLNHPNVCTVHDTGEYDGRPFIVMEVVHGSTLRQQLGNGPLQSRQVIDLAIQLADALDAAHAKGIIHRDIKPANIIVNERGHAKLLDFGLAKLSPDTAADSNAHAHLGAPTIDAVELTQPRSAVGTIAYMSPEQARGEGLDKRTDLFSLGAVLFEMVTGHQAFAGPSTAVVFDAILNRVPVPPANFSGMPARLAEIISNALEKERDLRYQTAADMLADLRRAKRDLESGRSSIASVTSLSATAATSIDPSSGPSRVRPATSSESSRPVPSTHRLKVFAAIGVGAVVLLTVFFAGRWRGTPVPTTVDRGVTALVQSQLALATDSLSRSEYESAIAYADAALTAAPGQAEALRIRAAARAALARVVDEPSAAPEQVAETQPRLADSPPPIPPPPRPRPELTTREAVPEVPDPPEVTAPPPPAAEAVVDTVPEPPTAPEVETPLEPPVNETLDARESDTDTQNPETTIPEAPPIEVAPQDEEAAIREVLESFEVAIETMNMALYRSVRPTLSADEASRVRAGFEAVQSQQVDLTILSIAIQDTEAVVRLSRRDTIQTGGGEQTQESRQTVTLTKTPDGWVIARMEG